MAGEAVVARLQRHLIGPLVRVGRQRRALAGLEVHHVRPLRLPQLQRHVVRLVEQRQRDAEAAQRLLRPGDRLEHQAELRARLQRLHLRRDVREAAVLRRDAPLPHEVAGRVQDRRRRAPGSSVTGLMPMTASPAPYDEPLAQRGHDPVDRIGRVVGLQPDRQPLRQTDGVGRVHDDPDLSRRVDQIQVGHQLGAGGDHLAGEAARQAQQLGAVGGVGEHVLAQLRHRPGLHAVVDRPLQIVEDQARDRVGLRRDDRVLVQLGQRHLGQHALGGDPLGDAVGGQAGQPIARLLLVGLGEDLACRSRKR